MRPSAVGVADEIAQSVVNSRMVVVKMEGIVAMKLFLMLRKSSFWSGGLKAELFLQL